MNKTLSVNIGGMAFKIDETAFQKLKNYLDSVKNRFQDTRDQQEIVSDIESRIGEIFSERLSDTKEVIVMSDVDHMIGIMGEPNDIGDIDDHEETTYGRPSGKRRLFRNPDDKVVAGVASGLSAYFGISDPIWMRLIFVVLTLVGVGAMIPIYILLWIIIPDALTTADKLQMRGEEANISNIEKSIRDGVSNLETSLKDLGSKKKIREAGSFFERIINIGVSIIRFVFLFFVKMIALFLIVMGALLFVSLVIALVTSSAFIFPPLSGLAGLVISSPLIMFLGIVGALLLAGIPTIALIYLGMRILIGQTAHIRGFGLGMLGFWIVGLILSAIVGVNIGKHFRENAKITETLTIQQPESDILFVDIIDFDKSEYYENSDVTEYDNFDIAGLFMTEDGIYLDDLRFNVELSKNDQFSIVQTSSASGSSNSKAKAQAEQLQSIIVQKDSLMNIDGFFKIEKGDKYRKQRIQLTLRIPEGKSISFTPTSYSFIRSFSRVSEDKEYKLTGNIWTMTSEGLKCQDCTNEDVKEFLFDDHPERIYEFKDFSKVNISGMYRVSIDQGDEYKVSLRGRDKNIDRVKVSMDGDKLVIDSKKFNFDRKAISINITMPELIDLEMEGASKLDIDGFNNDEMTIEFGGAIDASLSNIVSKVVSLTAVGANKIEMNGTTDFFDVTLAGATNLSAFDFIALRMDIDMAGACEAEANVSQELNADLAGPCRLRYKGDASIESDQVGFGDVERVY